MPDTTLPPEGSLLATSVSEVLGILAAERRTGLLRVDGGDPLLVALADGAVYLATSASGPSIHQIVVGSGAAPEAAWVDATESGNAIAAALAGDPRVDGERLRAVLQEHVTATVVELLAPGPERYEFLADQVHQLGARFLFAVDEVLAEASRRLAAWRSINETLPSTGTRLRRAPTLPAGEATVSMSALDWQVLAAVGTDDTVAEVIAASGLSAFTVFDVLHRLMGRGLVITSGDPRPT